MHWQTFRPEPVLFQKVDYTAVSGRSEGVPDRHEVNAQVLLTRCRRASRGCRQARPCRAARAQESVSVDSCYEVEHHHGPIGDPDVKPYGNGVLLWFEIDDFDSAVARAVEMNAEVVKPRRRNPPDGDGGPNHWECWLRDPDVYTVVIASPAGRRGEGEAGESRSRGSSYQTSGRARNCISRSLPPAQAGRIASATSATGYQACP